MMKAYFYSFVKNNKTKLSLLVLSIAVYFALALSAITLHKSIPEIAAMPFKGIGVQSVVQKNGKIPEKMIGAIFPHSNAPISAEEADKLSRLEFVEGYDKGLYLWHFDKSYFKAALGIEAGPGIFAEILKKNILQGEFDIANENIVIMDDFARKHGISLSDEIPISGVRHKVKGILKTNMTGNIIPADIYMNLTSAVEIAGNSEEMKKVYQFPDGNFSNVILLRTDPLWKGSKEKEIKTIGKDFIVFSEKTFTGEIAKQLSLISGAGRTIFAVMGIVLVTAFCLMVISGVKSREKEIALLRMLGWRIKDIKRHFISESFMLLSLSMATGNILAFAALKILSLRTVSMELPWDISAKPHFLPEENSIERVVQSTIPVHYDYMTFALLSIAFLLLFLAINYALFYKLKNIKPFEYGR
jgi:ABC-type lipoprotein release transport system permease subunit